MKKFFGTSLLLGLAVSALTAQTALNFGNLPLWFEASPSQAGGAPSYIARSGNSHFVISPTGATFALRQASGQAATCTMQFLGGNPTATVAGTSELAGKINHLVGNNPAQWQTEIPTFGQVRVVEVYPGINVVYYGNGQQLEYDFTVAAGANPRTIAIRFDGAKKIAVNGQGELVVSLPGGEVTQHRPVIYQLAGQVRREVRGGYTLRDARTVAFEIGEYDSSLPLVIDPILSFSTYFGGNNKEIPRAIATDNSGNVYIAGQTLSTVFTNVPAGAQHGSFKGGTGTGDAFVAKLNPNNTNSLVFLTYLGGSSDDTAYGIAVDTNQNVYLTGTTGSSDFPTNRALFGQIASLYVQSQSGNYYLGDAFVTKLNTNGSALVYSTYLGGYGQDLGRSIAVDATGNAYVTGWTSSTNFPFTANAFQKSLNCTNTLYFNANAFVAEINDDGTNLHCIYASYIGGNNFDWATGIAVDSGNNIYVTGFTTSTNFPNRNPIIATYTVGTNTVVTRYNRLNGATNATPSTDAFVAKFGPAFTNLIYSTFLGGTNNDVANAIAVDGAGNAYVVGSTVSTNYPVINAPSRVTSYVHTNASNWYWTTNAFLTQITYSQGAANAGIGFSTIFGGSWGSSGAYVVDTARGVTLDAAGNIYVTGSANSTNFPVTPENIFGALKATNSGGNDAFVMAFAPNGTALLYSAYLGGASDDWGYAVATDANGDVYVTGQTISTDFPTYHAWQSKLNGTTDAFVTKIQSAGGPVLQAQVISTNLLVFWQLTNDVTQAFRLETSTNLTATNWTVITNQTAKLDTNGAYRYTYTFGPTNSVQFFRFHK